MQPYEQRIHDLFDGDPKIEHEYHQDYREGITTPYLQISFILPILFCLLPITYHILQILDYDLLPLPELLWNCFVYITPWRIIDAIENFTNPLPLQNPALKNIRRTHAAKCEAMRRILGLDKPGGIIGTVAQASRRRLSTLPGINMVASGTDGRPAGLGNWDNSCYQNSVLQGLASLDALTGYLTNPNIEKEVEKGTAKPDMKMADALRGLISKLNDSENNGKKLWTPATLKNMSSFQQQDAQEYFSKVLDEIDKEVSQAANLIRTAKGIEAEDSGFSSPKISETPLSIYRNPLEGLVAQRVGCTKCGYCEGLSMIPFNCLTVPLGKAWGYDITECLDEYTKLEQIEGVECGKCTLQKIQRQLSTILDRTKDSPELGHIHTQSRARLEAVSEALEEDDYEDKTLNQKCKIPTKNRVSTTKTRQAVIARPPKSLVIHFNRSLFDEMTGELRKNYSEVSFPKTLDLGPWCLGSSGTSTDGSVEEWILNPDKPMIASNARPSRLHGPMYELRAVVTHYGRHENGHYICYRKHPTGGDGEKEKKEQWWRLSDEDVMKVSEENVLGQGGVFMLFYDCIEPASPMSEKPAPLESTNSVESTIPLAEITPPDRTPSIEQSEDLALASATPLPDIDDTDLDLSSLSDTNTNSNDDITLTESTGTATATSVSEFDEEETPDQDQDTEYHPTKAIVVPSYIPQTGGDKQREAVLEGSKGGLVMV